MQPTAISKFIVDDADDDIVDYAGEDESKEDDELFDTVCTFCDNGGDLLWYALAVQFSYILMLLIFGIIK